MCQNLFVQVMTDLLEKSIKRQAKMLRANEVPTNDFLKAKDAFLLDTDEVRTVVLPRSRNISTATLFT